MTDRLNKEFCKAVIEYAEKKQTPELLKNIEEMLKNGADLNTLDPDSILTAEGYASYRPELVKLFVMYGLDPNKPEVSEVNGVTLLPFSTYFDYGSEMADENVKEWITDMLLAYLEVGADPFLKDDYNDNIFGFAIKYEIKDVIRYIRNNGYFNSLEAQKAAFDVI